MSAEPGLITVELDTVTAAKAVYALQFAAAQFDHLEVADDDVSAALSAAALIEEALDG